MKISLLDKLVVLLAAGVCTMSFVWLWQSQEGGQAQFLEVRHGGQVERYSLTEDRYIEVETSHGHSIIEVHDGQARFTQSSCTKQLCVLAGWLSRSGQIAVCLPNGISVQLMGQDSYDTINF